MSLIIQADDVEICMLLKDEELLVEATLLELKKFFCKFSIIDQGSRDRTIEIVRDLIGKDAKIRDKNRGYILETGFARARNELTTMCELPWVFHIDADEQLVSGIQNGLIVADTIDGEISLLHVERRNLERPEVRPDNIFPSDTSQFPIMSIERIPRIYNRGSPIIWKSFIHEEIVKRDTLTGFASSSSKIVLNHLSQLKDNSSREYKEELYGWMIVKGDEETGYIEDKLSGYSEEVLASRKDYFKEMARRFSFRSFEA